MLQFLTEKEIKYDDGLPIGGKKICQPCLRKVKNITEIRALIFVTGSTFFIGVVEGFARTKFVARNRLENHLLRVNSRKRLPVAWTTKISKVFGCAFLSKAIKIRTKLPLSLDPLLPRITAPRRLPKFCKVVKKNMMPPARGRFKCPRVLGSGLF